MVDATTDRAVEGWMMGWDFSGVASKVPRSTTTTDVDQPRACVCALAGWAGRGKKRSEAGNPWQVTVGVGSRTRRGSE